MRAVIEISLKGKGEETNRREVDRKCVVVIGNCAKYGKT